MQSKPVQIYKLLNKSYPNSRVYLNYSNPWELLVAVILSAQCTDKRVNLVTDKLFKKYKTLEDYSQADIKQFEQDIRSTGFYHNKAKNILKSAKIIKTKFKGKVPDRMQDLISLHGVARKTANIILSEIYRIEEGIAVDTHVKRLSNRLGFSEKSDPLKIEIDLMNKFDKKYWRKLTILLIEHGRAICNARKPNCKECVLNKLCPSAFKF